MILGVRPTPRLRGHIHLPASKSYSIRAFIISACGGSSTIINPSDCDDAKVAIHVARSLGAEVIRQKGNVFKVTALKHRSHVSSVNVRESGTALRFVLPLLSLRGTRAKIVGEGTLIGRPNLFLTETLRRMGMDIKGTGQKESVPIQINGGRLTGGTINIDGSLSSQFISALLITCPQLNEDTVLKIKGKTVSEDYITMTKKVLQKAGIKIQKRSRHTYIIKGRQTFRGLNNFTVPSDYGLAAFLMAGAILTSSEITLRGFLKDDLIQADGWILSFLKKMGARISKSQNSIKILSGEKIIKGGNFSLKSCPDLVPIMVIMALFAKGKTCLADIYHARAKESDRISDLRKELLKIGANIKESKNGMVIEPQEKYRSQCLLDPHRDHRLAMAFAVLGLKLAVYIKDIECVSKSYPAFVHDLKKLGACLK